MSNKTVWIALLCGIYISVSWAQSSRSSVRGVVTDKRSGEKLPYVPVSLVEVGGEDSHQHRFLHLHKESVAADENGGYRVPTLHAGVYKITVDFFGYLPFEKEIVLGDNEEMVIDIPLEEQVFEMDEVVVSANRNEVSRRDAPVVVNVLNGKLFENTNSCDLSQGLNFQSGLRVENNCQNCGFPQVRINGLDGPYSQILIDSRPVLSALSGVYGLEQIPVNMIDRVEVVRGGGSALFGSNAVAGTINIITKDPIDNSFQVSSSAGLLNGDAPQTQMNANVALVTKDNKGGISLYQTFRNRHQLDLDGDGFSEIGKINARSFGLRGYIRPTDMSRLSLEYHSTQEFRRGGNLFDLQPHQTDITEQTDHSINGGGITYDLFFDDYRHKLSLYGSMQHIDRNSYYGAGRDTSAYGKTSDLTWVTGATYTLNMERCLVSPATFTSGVEYQSNVLHDRMIGYHRDLKQDVHIGGGFVQNEWKGDRISVLMGLRMDKHNLIDRLIFSPRVNLLYKPNEHIQSRLTFSTGFRAPQAYDEDLHVAAVGGEGMLIQLAPGLKEERSYSYSGSVDLYENFGVWQTNLLVEAFYTDLRDVFVLEEIGHDENGHLIQERRNGKGAEVYGLNLDGKIAYANQTQLQIGFTVQQSRYKEPYIWAQHTDPVRNMVRTPNTYGYMTLTYQVFKPMQLAVTGTYTGRMYIPHFQGYILENRMERSPRFYDLNLKLSYDFNLFGKISLQVNAGVQNIFDSRQKDYDQGPDRDSKYFYGPAQPRTYFAGLKIFSL